jgi:hypothetical protein
MAVPLGSVPNDDFSTEAFILLELPNEQQGQVVEHEVTTKAARAAETGRSKREVFMGFVDTGNFEAILGALTIK